MTASNDNLLSTTFDKKTIDNHKPNQKHHDSDKLNTPFVAATWSVRTLYQTGKFENNCQISDRVLLVKIRAKAFNLPVIQGYAPTSECSEEDLDAFYRYLGDALKICKSQKVVITKKYMTWLVLTGHLKEMKGIGKRDERRKFD
ncbi:hypothetical protein HELRODRAFT_160139 [Helobdella robusta]|uniref:Uncharacterized protein n=1 Tax=Helobdella robusta TaxID=6412 RepID=T1EPV3_HELRO|nr:hypothetical protein HELRODRAFT_160139 [Helobdella robusta]ESO06026.1 hypothetical protein HELRODRAFT_160139 [Helobdella robusta]